MKAFIESQFSYYFLIRMFHSRTMNNKVSRIHERDLRLVYSDYSFSFDELLQNGSFSIHDWSIQTLAIEIHTFFSWSLVKYNEKHFSG